MLEKDRKVTRGEVYMADLPAKTVGSVQAGRRPVVVTQSNWLNEHSPTFVAAIVTSRLKKQKLDSHVVLPQVKFLPKRSMVEAEQRYTIDKAQVIEYLGTLDSDVMKEITKALHRSEESDQVTKHRRRSHYRRRKSGTKTE